MMLWGGPSRLQGRAADTISTMTMPTGLSICRRLRGRKPRIRLRDMAAAHPKVTSGITIKIMASWNSWMKMRISELGMREAGVYGAIKSSGGDENWKT